MTPERHSAFLRPPEILASIDLDSDSEYPELVDDDTSSGEEEEEETVASLERTVKNRGRGTVKSEPQKERTAFKFNSDTALRLHERSIRDRLRTADWNRLYRDKTGVYRPCILISQPQRDKARLVFRCDLAEIDECVREDKTFLQRVNLDTVGQVKQSNRLKLFTLTLVDTEAEWTESAPLLLQPGKQTVAPLMSIPESRRLSNETDRSDSANTKRDWCPTGNSVCRLLHREDIGSRWVEIVAARLKKLKKRSGVRERARKKKAGDADRIWLTSQMAAIKKATTESTNVRELYDQAQAAKVHQRFERAVTQVQDVDCRFVDFDIDMDAAMLLGTVGDRGEAGGWLGRDAAVGRLVSCHRFVARWILICVPFDRGTLGADLIRFVMGSRSA